MGNKNEFDAAIPTPITKARGSTPRLKAVLIAMGATRTAAAATT